MGILRLRSWSLGVKLAQSSWSRSQRTFDIAVAICKALNRANLNQMLFYPSGILISYLSAVVLWRQRIASLPR